MCGKRVVLCLVLAACGPAVPGQPGDDGGNHGGDGGGGPGTIRVEPANLEVSTSPGAPAEIDYSAIYTNEDGTEEDITNEATWSLVAPTFGTFSGSHLTTSDNVGGRTVVRAAARGTWGETDLTIRLSTVVIGPGADAGSPGKFIGSTDPSRAPTLIYPDDGVLVPPNLNELEFHFMPGAGNTLFELAFVGAAIDLRIYFTCQPIGSGCGFTPDESTWTILADAQRGETAATWTLRGVDGASPGTVGVSASRALSFGQQDIVGGLYYWNAGAGAIRRYDFGRRGQTAEPFLDAARAGATTCVGCHVLSRDGTRIAVGMDIPAPSPYKVFDVATRTALYSQGSMFGGGSNFFSFSPDSSEIMTSNGIDTVWRNAATGVAIADPLVQGATMPDWSADGLNLVVSRPGMTIPCFPGGFCGAPGVDSASLEVVPWNGSMWGSPRSLVAFGGQNNYYPAWSPDNGWVMFNRSPSNTNSFDAPDAEVWIVAGAGGTPIQMARASTGGDSWPKWAPDVQPYRGGTLMWFTFSSRRAYGLRSTGGTSQLWMSAFDPAKAASGMDPSTPAFWLPFQEPASGNHIAQWVTTVERQPCTTDMDCGPGEFCEDSGCVPMID
jgi:hypothetical protein